MQEPNQLRNSIVAELVLAADGEILQDFMLVRKRKLGRYFVIGERLLQGWKN